MQNIDEVVARGTYGSTVGEKIGGSGGLGFWCDIMMHVYRWVGGMVKESYCYMYYRFM